MRRGVDGEAQSIGTAVLGAGPAGLTAAWVLARRGRLGEVFEADGVVGGIAKTVEFKGYRFDLGGHRFFTKLKPVERIWEEVMGDELLTRPRLSRIYYQGKFLAYPLQAKEVIKRLGLVESTLCALSYFWSRLRRVRTEETFEDWVVTRFGRRLYNAFFRSYTEKVWGIPGRRIQSEWAAQRIKNFSFARAMLAIVGLRRTNVTTLIDEFRYPRLRPGQMWERFQEIVEAGGIPVRLNHRVVALRHDGAGRVESVVVRRNGGPDEEVQVESVLPSLPPGALAPRLDPPPPPAVVAAAQRHRYSELCRVVFRLAV